MRGLIRTGAGLAVVFAAGVATPASADAPESGRDRRWFGTVYAMARVESRLPRIPEKIVTASLPFRSAYLVSIAVNHVAVPRFTIPLPFAKSGLRGNSLELEGQFVQHFGKEHAPEIDGALVLRSGQVGLIGRTSANFAWGNGLSYSLTRPDDEFGPSGMRGVDSRHLQYHMSFETEFTSAAAPHVHYVVRLHHRSGIYGVISPSRTGSNYLGAGLRIDFGH